MTIFRSNPAAPCVPAWDTWRKPNMHFGRRTVLQTAIAAVVLAGGMPAQAQEVLNIYSARHYQTDDALYSGFTEKTGIEINRIEAARKSVVQGKSVSVRVNLRGHRNLKK